MASQFLKMQTNYTSQGKLFEYCEFCLPLVKDNIPRFLLDEIFTNSFLCANERNEGNCGIECSPFNFCLNCNVCNSTKCFQGSVKTQIL